MGEPDGEMTGHNEPETFSLRKVYLDQSDWSYLCDGKHPAAETVLRRLGAQQRVAFLVSLEHFIEVGGLTAGFDDRLRFMREFPSTVWMNRGP